MHNHIARTSQHRFDVISMSLLCHIFTGICTVWKMILYRWWRGCYSRFEIDVTTCWWPQGPGYETSTTLGEKYQGHERVSEKHYTVVSQQTMYLSWCILNTCNIAVICGNMHGSYMWSEHPSPSLRMSLYPLCLNVFTRDQSFGVNFYNLLV